MSNTSRTQVASGKNGKPKKRYPHMGFRPLADLQQRIERLCKKTNLNQSQIVNACLANHLPILERKIVQAAETLGKKAA